MENTGFLVKQEVLTVLRACFEKTFLVLEQTKNFDFVFHFFRIYMSKYPLNVKK